MKRMQKKLGLQVKTTKLNSNNVLRVSDFVRMP